MKLHVLTEAPLSYGAQGRYMNYGEAAIALLSLENGAVAQKIWELQPLLPLSLVS